jgi:two-component system phosphate regulon sensor histidine kinase PhoR
MGQVLENLITNGIKYNEPGGRVEVTVRQTEDDLVLFSVTDDGIGLSREHFDRVTERFYRVDRSRSRERGGTGLGLAIVKHILEAHGSKLRINSAPGRGSTFSFALDSADESLD